MGWEMNKMVEDKKIEYVENQEVVMKELKLELDTLDLSRVKKVRFITDKGDITWKPKKKVKQFISGFETERIDNMNIDDLPDLLKKIQNIINNNGKCKLLATYQLMNTTNPENEPVQYRFITSNTFLDKWVIKEESNEVKEEKIV